ncbi:hypothetical protein L211DRAFT_847837 [Terfezia boudieri ATCC MYA-4762]|uniref:Uncharacterized protein n=1 Tax=Terfezia boudieri ATCC MYA-4762 TaxID=1051890 RepID=A0A3N4LRM3_9PEZI|nr:hypothetical protein L211DRAFT_847837 [Terfezia boudieri ATCC MYA-4762]
MNSLDGLDGLDLPNFTSMKPNAMRRVFFPHVSIFCAHEHNQAIQAIQAVQAVQGVQAVQAGPGRSHLGRGRPSRFHAVHGPRPPGPTAGLNIGRPVANTAKSGPHPPSSLARHPEGQRSSLKAYWAVRIQQLLDKDWRIAYFDSTSRENQTAPGIFSEDRNGPGFGRDGLYLGTKASC